MKRLVITSATFIISLFSVHSHALVTLDETNTQLKRNININATIIRSIGCGLTVDQNNKNYTVRADQVLNYGDFFETGFNITTYADVLSKIPSFQESTQAFKFTLTCNYPSPVHELGKTYQLKITPKATLQYANSSGVGNYRYLVFPATSVGAGGDGGFVFVGDGDIGIINTKNFQSGINGFIFDLGPDKTCNPVGGVPMGTMGYCALTFFIAPVFVAANTSSSPTTNPTGKNTVYAPKSWVKKTSYQVSFDVTAEFY